MPLRVPLRIFLCAALCSVPLMISQAAELPVLITHQTSGPPPSPEVKQVLEQLETSLADSIQEQFPCVVSTTTADLKDKYGEAKGRESASDEQNNDVAEMASAVGARDVIQVKVLSAGGKFSIDVVYQDAKTARPQARSNALVDGSEGSLDDFSSKFADSLRTQPRFSGASCPAEREWSGVIRYSFYADPKSTKKPSKECKEEMRSKESWRYSIRIPAVGPATAVVLMSRAVIQDTECTRKINCGPHREWIDEVYINQNTSQWVGADRVDARVSFDVVQGKLYISADLPQIRTNLMIEGETRYHSECAVPDPKKTSVQSAMPLIPRVPRVPPQPVAPGQRKLSGAYSDGEGGQTSWRLVRTSKK